MTLEILEHFYICFYFSKRINEASFKIFLFYNFILPVIFITQNMIISTYHRVSEISKNIIIEKLFFKFSTKSFYIWWVFTLRKLVLRKISNILKVETFKLFLFEKYLNDDLSTLRWTKWSSICSIRVVDFNVHISKFFMWIF